MAIILRQIKRGDGGFVPLSPFDFESQETGNISGDVSELFGFVYIGNIDEDGGFFHASESRINCCSETTHRRGKTHISIDQRRDIFP